MRYIQTSNKHIQFIEADDNGIIKSRGFEFGTVTYQISNGKITFYPVDTDKPWSQDLWSINIPFIMDGETYLTPEEAGAALGGIMDNSLLDKIEEVQQTVASQQQEIEDLDDNLSEVSDDLDAEVVRASAKDAEHDAAIDDLANDISDEEARATSAETALQTAINAETTRAMDEESAIRGSVNAEVSRATSAESALQASITAETNRAQSAETANANAISAEEDRAIAAETALHAEVVAETNRAQTAESGLQTSIASESNRAQSAETEIHNEISAERTRALNAESALSESINAEVTRATAKEASQDALISGLDTSLTAEINRATGAENGLRSDLNAEVSARTATDNSLIQRVTAVEVGKADANSVYTKQESDAKYATKDYVSGLTDNFYTKGQTNELLAAKADKANAVASAEYISNNKIINFKNIDGTVISSIDATDFIKDGMVDNVKVENGYLVITFNTDSGKEAISIPLTDIFDPANYYTKSEVNTALSGKVDNAAFNTLSGDVYSISGDVVTISGSVETVRQEITTISGDSYTKQEVNTAIDAATSGKADTSVVTAHTANTTVHVTASEKQAWNAKSDFSGDYNDLTNKPTIPSLDGYATEAYVSGYTYDKNTIDEKIAQGGTFDPTLYYKKSETSGATELSTAFSAKLDTTAYTPTDLSNYYTKGETSGKTEISNALSNKLDTTAYTPTDLSNYYQKSETSGKTELSTAFTNKQDVLVSGVSIKTINSQSLLGQGNIDIQGGGSSITVVQTTGTSTGDVMSQSAVTASLSGKADSSALTAHTANTTVHVTASEKQTWNNKSNFSGSYNDLTNKPTIPTIWTGTQAQFDAITVKNENTIYLVQ